MDQVLNAKERTQAFWKFLLFFLIAVSAIILCVFFYYQVPKKQNAILKEKTDQYQKHTTSEEKFTAAMLDANVLLDSLDKPGANVVYLNQLIAGKLAVMTDLHNADASRQSQIFLNIMSKYQEAKTKLIGLKDVSTQLEKVKNDYNQCNTQLEQARNTISILSRTSGSNY